MAPRVFLSMDVVLIGAYSADPDEMQCYAAFHFATVPVYGYMETLVALLELSS